MIRQTFLNRYRSEVEQASKDAKDYIQAITDAYRIAYPEASVADIRNYTCDAIQDAVNVFGGQASLIANDFFEEIARDAGEDVQTEIYNSFDPDKANSKVRYLASDIVNGDVDAFNGKVSDLTAYYVKREAFQNMLKNCKKNGVRYARVPSGLETCAFCFMLASRGFVYWGEEEAGGYGHSYHSHCDCIIVPGFSKDSGVNPDAQIEGYKPSELYDRYKMCYNTLNPSGTWEEVYEEWKKSDSNESWMKFKTKALVKEINTRDWGWLWTGEPAIIDDSEKPKSALTVDERDAVNWLSMQGVAVKTKGEDPKAVKNIDFEIWDEFYEHKNVTNLSSVSNQIKRSREKFYKLGINEMRHVLTLNDRTVSEEEIIEKLKGKVKDNEEILIVFKDKLLRIKK